MCYDKCNKIDKRLWLFGCESLEELKEHKNNDNKIIVEEMERLSMDEEFRDEYDYENVQRKLQNSARENGYNEGITQGINQEKMNIAKNLLNKGMNINKISEITGLSIDEINKLN